jgi:hypothetical protein
MAAFLVWKYSSSAAFMRSRVYLIESKAYLRNPDSAEATAAHQEALVLEGINIIMSGGEINAAHSNNNPVVNEERSVNNNDNDGN